MIDDDRVTLTPTAASLDRVSEDAELEIPEVWGADDIWDYWMSTWRGRLRDQFDVSMIVTGESGVGKSALALKAGQAIDPSISPETIGDHVAFTADEFLRLMNVARPEQVIIFDEGVRGLLSSDTMSPEQKALTTALAIVRAKRLVLIILAPDIWQLAKNLRNRKAEYWVTIQSRGVAWVHEQRHDVHYKPDPTLGFSIDRVHGPLQWGSLDGTPLWDAYFRLKMKRMQQYLGEASDDLASKRRRRDQRHERGGAE